MSFPFHIRGLKKSTCLSAEEERYQPSNAALFDISAADYDDIVSNHPQARLTYLDEEKERITVRLYNWQARSPSMELTIS